MHTSFSPLRTPLRLTVMAAVLASLSLPTVPWLLPISSSARCMAVAAIAARCIRNDFIEVFNRGASPVNLDNWSVQYASAAGSSWSVTALPAIDLQPGQYLLVQQAKGAGGTAALPTPDASGSVAMSGTAGKVLLSNSKTAQTGVSPTGAAVVDLVGFGTANGFEGNVAPAPSNTLSIARANGGCGDTDDNSSGLRHRQRDAAQYGLAAACVRRPRRAPDRHQLPRQPGAWPWAMAAAPCCARPTSMAS